MASYLPCKCKHLCMLKFRVVSPSLTKNSVYSAYSRQCYYQSDNMIPMMLRTFHCSSRFSSGFILLEYIETLWALARSPL